MGLLLSERCNSQHQPSWTNAKNTVTVVVSRLYTMTMVAEAIDTTGTAKSNMLSPVVRWVSGLLLMVGLSLLSSFKAGTELKEEHRTLAIQSDFDAYNTAWKQTINNNMTCYRGREYGNSTFPISPQFIVIGAQKVCSLFRDPWKLSLFCSLL